MNKYKIAEIFADKLESYIGEQYAALIDGLKTVGPKGKEYLRNNVRWTLVDDATNENLLQTQEDKVKSEGHKGLAILAREFLKCEWHPDYLNAYADALRYELHKIKTGKRVAS